MCVAICLHVSKSIFMIVKANYSYQERRASIYLYAVPVRFV